MRRFVLLAVFATVPAHAADTAALWPQIEQVLTHPRCLNCHSASDAPRQSDDRHRHRFRVRNGPAGQGVAGNPCLACHRAVNQATSGVPGAPNWQHAPASMTWEDATGRPLPSRLLCQTLIDPAKNGGRTLPQLLSHMNDEALVRWAWSPGTDAQGSARSTPPLTHAAFVDRFARWIEAGARCPQR